MKELRILTALFAALLLTAPAIAQQPKTKVPPTATNTLPATVRPGTAAKPTAKPATKPPTEQAKSGTLLTPKPQASAAKFQVVDDEAEVTDAEAYKPHPIDTLTAPTIIAFGSCNKLDKPQNMWGDVAANNPNLWIWLGDIIYADTSDMKALSGM
ncbi:MAG: hypothetical protein ABIQ93_16205, partial [Saprospiraceae bacterium]